MSIADEEMDVVTHIPPKPRPGSIPYFQPRPKEIRLSSDPLEPARRAGATMLVLAAVALLVGLFLMVSPLDSHQPYVSEFQQLNAAGVLAVAVAFTFLGMIVRNGTRGPAATALILAVLAAGYLLVVAVAEVRHTRSALDSALLFLLALLAVLVILVRWLVRAVMIAPHLAEHRRRQGQSPSILGKAKP